MALTVPHHTQPPQTPAPDAGANPAPDGTGDTAARKDAKYRQALREMKMKKLLEEQKLMAEDAERARLLLEATAARGGGTAALDPYVVPVKNPTTVKVIAADADMEKKLLQKEGLAEKFFVSGAGPGMNPEQALAQQKEWLAKTFTNTKTDAVLVHTEDGRTLIGTLGVSMDEANAALTLQAYEKDRKTKSAEIAEEMNGRSARGTQQPDHTDDDHRVLPPPPTPPVTAAGKATASLRSNA